MKDQPPRPLNVGIPLSNGETAVVGRIKFGTVRRVFNTVVINLDGIIELFSKNEQFKDMFATGNMDAQAAAGLAQTALVNCEPVLIEACQACIENQDCMDWTNPDLLDLLAIIDGVRTVNDFAKIWTTAKNLLGPELLASLMAKKAESPGAPNAG